MLTHRKSTHSDKRVLVCVFVILIFVILILGLLLLDGTEPLWSDAWKDKINFKFLILLPAGFVVFGLLGILHIIFSVQSAKKALNRLDQKLKEIEELESNMDSVDLFYYQATTYGRYTILYRNKTLRISSAVYYLSEWLKAQVDSVQSLHENEFGYPRPFLVPDLGVSCDFLLNFFRILSSHPSMNAPYRQQVASLSDIRMLSKFFQTPYIDSMLHLLQEEKTTNSRGFYDSRETRMIEELRKNV
jgi:hypothetical protein